jgi:uncharacterized membrane protein YgaE (UPF0421/DUF939 family)
MTAGMKASHKMMTAIMKASLEEMEAVMDTNQEELNAMDLQPNPEEKEAMVEHLEVPNEEAEVYTRSQFYLFLSNELHRGSASTKLRVMSLVSQGYTGVGLVPEQLIVTH